MNNPKKLKVISLNIWLGGLLFDKIIDFIKKENPDILLLQEVFNSHDSSHKREYKSLDYLKENLEFKYSHFAPALLENIGNGVKIEQGNAILSKFPIEAVSVKFFDVPFGVRVDEEAYYHVTPRNLQHVVISLDNIVDTEIKNSDNINTSSNIHQKKLHVLIHKEFGVRMEMITIEG